MIKKINLERFNKKGLYSFQKGKNADKLNAELSLSKRQRWQRVIESLDKQPALPGFIYQIIHLTENTASKPEDFIPLFSDCQEIVEKMLILANTSFYGAEKEITSIPEAIELLGHKTLRSLAYTALAKTAYKNSAKVYGFTPTGLWQHSVAVANVARRLTLNFGYSQKVAEELFVAGLVHDIGKIVIGKQLGNYNADYIKFKNYHNDSGSVSAMERELVNIDHEEVARMLALHWDLSENIINAINYQATDSVSDEEHYNLFCIVRLADYLAFEARIGLVENYHWQIKIPGSAMKQLKIDADRLEMIREEMSTILHEVSLL